MTSKTTIARVSPRSSGKVSERLLALDIEKAAIVVCLTVLLAGTFFSDLIPHVGTLQAGSLWLGNLFAFVRLLRKRGLLAPSSCFWLWAAFALFVMANPGIGDYARGVPGLSKWNVFFPGSLILWPLLREDSERWAGFVVRAVAVLAAVHAVATLVFFVEPGWYQSFFNRFFLGRNVVNAGYKSGLTGHYSTNGMYLAHGLIASFAIFLGKGAKRGWQALFCILLVALLLTTKRAHLVFGLAACACAFLASEGSSGMGKTGKLFAGVTVLLLAFYIASEFVPEFALVIERLQGVSGDETFGGRSQYYEICLDMFRSSPLVGHGWGSFTPTLYHSDIADLVRLYRNGNLSQQCHSLYYGLLAEGGLVGLLLFAAAAVSCLRATLGSVRSGSRRVGWMPAWSLGVQLFFLLYGITGHVQYMEVEYILYLLACSIAFLEPARPRARKGLRS